MNVCFTIVWHLHLGKHKLLLILSSFCTFLSGISHIIDHRVYICMSLMVRGMMGCSKWHGYINFIHTQSLSFVFEKNHINYPILSRNLIFYNKTKPFYLQSCKCFTFKTLRICKWWLYFDFLIMYTNNNNDLIQWCDCKDGPSMHLQMCAPLYSG